MKLQGMTNDDWRFLLAKMFFRRILITGCARRGVSGALFPKSAYAGLNSRPRILYLEPLDHFDWTPRNRRSRTSSGPEGSSDKWCGLCRGLISICIMWRGFLKGSTAGAQPSLSIWDFRFRIADFNKVKYLILYWLINKFCILSLTLCIQHLTIFYPIGYGSLKKYDNNPFTNSKSRNPRSVLCLAPYALSLSAYTFYPIPLNFQRPTSSIHHRVSSIQHRISSIPPIEIQKMNP